MSSLEFIEGRFGESCSVRSRRQLFCLFEKAVEMRNVVESDGITDLGD